MSLNIFDRVCRNKVPIALILVVFFAGAFISSYMFAHFYSPVDESDETRINVSIPKSASAEEIAALLEEKGLIRNKQAFLHYCKEAGVDSMLKAGLYTISPSESVQEIASKIASGDTARTSVTIPEGYTVDRIGALLVKEGLCSEEDWEKAATQEYDYYFLKSAPGDVKYQIEGFLFPDTYEFQLDSTAEELVRIMLDRFQAEWEKSLAGPAEENGRELWVVMTVASMIEKEAELDSERATIAGVINNRLQSSMKLQFCSTVIYSMKTPKTVVTYSDLEIDSPYNTYKYKGLPPGPIASPGIKSIEAAISPESHDYLFFVATGNGAHTFSKTFEEHVEAQN